MDIHLCFYACSSVPIAPWVFQYAPQANNLEASVWLRLQFGWPPTNTAVLYHTYQPPVAVTVVEQYHGIAFRCIRLSFNRGDKRMKRINEVEIDVL